LREGDKMKRKIERAILSVTDKSGIVEFAKGLKEFGVEILSTGGTAKILKDAGVEVVEISKYTGFPEILDGRVKSLHPKIHGGILAIRDKEDHIRMLKEHQIVGIDLIAVNLYQFERAVSREGITLEEAVEEIDIGGPTLIRAGAKNHRFVTVVVDLKDYQKVLDEMKESGGYTSLKLRFELAKKAFQLTHQYDGAIYRYLNSLDPEALEAK